MRISFKASLRVYPREYLALSGLGLIQPQLRYSLDLGCPPPKAWSVCGGLLGDGAALRRWEEWMMAFPLFPPSVVHCDITGPTQQSPAIID